MAGIQLESVTPARSFPATWYQHGVTANASDDPPSWGSDASMRDPGYQFLDWQTGQYTALWGNGPVMPTALAAELLWGYNFEASAAITTLAIAMATTQLVTSAYAKDEDGHTYFGVFAGDESFTHDLTQDTALDSMSGFVNRVAIDGFDWFREFRNGDYQQYIPYLTQVVEAKWGEMGTPVVNPSPGPTTPDAPIAADGWRRMTNSIGTTAPSTAYGIQQIGSSLYSAIN